MAKEIIGFINKNNDIFNLKDNSSASYCCKVGQGHENKIAAFTEDGDLKDSGKTINDLVTRVQPSVNGNLASLDENGNLVDSGAGIDTVIEEGNPDLVPSGTIYNVLQGKANSNHSHSEIKAPGAFANYAYARITQSGALAPAFFLKVGGSNDMSASVEVNVNNIENLQRALENPDATPTPGGDKLITSSAVAEGLNRKANSTHIQSIETIVGLNAVIASLTERIRALEEQPITESIPLTGTYPGYNTLLNEDSEDILYYAQSTERKILCNIDTLYNFAEIGSAVTLSYTVPNTSSDTIVTFNTIVVDKISGPSRLVLRDSIPDVQYVNYTDITLTITK